MTKIIYTSTDLSDPAAQRAWSGALDLAEEARQAAWQARREQAQSKTMVDLFEMTTTVSELHGCKDVVIHWFMMDRGPVVPYAEAIADYDPAYNLIIYAELCVDELFTRKEAETLRDYLKQESPACRHEIVKRVLPVPRNTMGIGAIPTGGPQIGWSFSPRDGWPLKVGGYADLRSYEPAPGREADLARRRALKSNLYAINPQTGKVVCEADLEVIDPLN